MLGQLADAFDDVMASAAGVDREVRQRLLLRGVGAFALMFLALLVDGNERGTAAGAVALDFVLAPFAEAGLLIVAVIVAVLVRTGTSGNGLRSVGEEFAVPFRWLTRTLLVAVAAPLLVGVTALRYVLGIVGTMFGATEADRRASARKGEMLGPIVMLTLTWIVALWAGLKSMFGIGTLSPEGRAIVEIVFGALLFVSELTQLIANGFSWLGLLAVVAAAGFTALGVRDHRDATDGDETVEVEQDLAAAV